MISYMPYQSGLHKNSWKIPYENTTTQVNNGCRLVNGTFFWFWNVIPECRTIASIYKRFYTIVQINYIKALNILLL